MSNNAFFLIWLCARLGGGSAAGRHPAGTVALLIDRSSWLARGAAALNALLLTGFLLLLARLLV